MYVGPTKVGKKSQLAAVIGTAPHHWSGNVRQISTKSHTCGFNSWFDTPYVAYVPKRWRSLNVLLDLPSTKLTKLWKMDRWVRWVTSSNSDVSSSQTVSHYQRVNLCKSPFSHDSPMVFLWFSYGFPMICPSLFLGLPAEFVIPGQGYGFKERYP